MLSLWLGIKLVIDCFLERAVWSCERLGICYVRCSVDSAVDLVVSSQENSMTDCLSSQIFLVVSSQMGLVRCSVLPRCTHQCQRTCEQGSGLRRRPHSLPLCLIADDATGKARKAKVNGRPTWFHPPSWDRWVLDDCTGKKQQLAGLGSSVFSWHSSFWTESWIFRLEISISD